MSQHPVHQHEPPAWVQKELAVLVLVRLARQKPVGDVLKDLLQRTHYPRCQGLWQHRRDWNHIFPFPKDTEGNVFGAHASTSWIDTEGGWVHQCGEKSCSRQEINFVCYKDVWTVWIYFENNITLIGGSAMESPSFSQSNQRWQSSIQLARWVGGRMPGRCWFSDDEIENDQFCSISDRHI